MTGRYNENFWPFKIWRMDFSMILLILNRVIHRGFTSPIPFLLPNGWVSSGRNLFLLGHSEKSGRNLFLPVLSRPNWKKLEKTVKDVRNTEKKRLSYLISYKRLWLQMHLVNRYCLKTRCRKSITFVLFLTIISGENCTKYLRFENFVVSATDSIVTLQKWILDLFLPWILCKVEGMRNNAIWFLIFCFFLFFF